MPYGEFAGCMPDEERGGVQISLVGPIGDGPGRPVVDHYIEQLTRARDAGFRRVWTSQLPWEADLLTVLGVALREVDGIDVGTAVLPIQVQHPSQLAQRALVVNQIAGGRLQLGLGLDHAGINPDVNPFDRPVRRMEEYLDGLLPLLAGRSARAVGGTVTTRVRLRIPGAPEPEVYLAAWSSRMLRLAGRRTSGTITWMAGPKTLAEQTGPVLREAAEAAGRAKSAVRVVACLPVSVTDDVDAVRAAAAGHLSLYGQLPSHRAMLDREGFAGPEDAALIGDEATVSERIAELRSAGVDEFGGYVFDLSAEDGARTRALLSTVGADFA